ncbi:MAG: MBL fold metallo-hydrolase [Candidatus Dormibacteria bacterium]
MEAFVCVTCGVQQPPSRRPPRRCQICSDQRQYVPESGQRWTTLGEMEGHFRNEITELEPDLFRIHTEPEFGIGQGALLVRTAQGNLLWDCVTHLDPETKERVRQLGGLRAIAISHPHFYGSLVEWSGAFGEVPVYLSARDRRHLVRGGPSVVHFAGERIEPLPTLSLLRLGGHFDGSTVLHWPGGAQGRGVLLTGDTVAVVTDRRWVTFMYSYPNRIPLPAGDIERMARRLRRLPFDRIYGPWPKSRISTGAKRAVLRSARRYQGMLAGTWPRD